MENKLKDYDEKFMAMAITASKQATCDRLHVGCTVTVNGKVYGVGYNDSPEGTTNCDEGGHVMHEGSCKRTIHAEVNACLNAIKFIQDITGAIVYVTAQPCSDCLKFMTRLGVSKVFFLKEYHFKYEVETDIEVVKVDYEF